MRVLLVNNHHKIVGGTERYYFDLAKLLQSKGHKIAYFSTKDKGNLRTYWQKYFIRKNDFKNRKLGNFIKLFPNMFYSFEARRNISKLLDEFKPDIVHLQNIYYYISPSILKEITKRNIPIVQTVHDYQLISPNVVMFHNGEICQITKINKFYRAVFHKCIKDSYVATLMSVISLYFQNINHFYEKSIDVFITPSKFMKNKLEEYGFGENKTVFLNNFLESDFTKNLKLKIGENYILYFGRLNEAKGLFSLLEVAKKLPDIPIKLVGDFEDKKTKENAFKIIKHFNIKNIQILPFTKGYKLIKLIKNSVFTIIPSLWYENQPYSILETYALGKPVIAGKIGGIPEIVIHGKTGYLFKPNDTSDLVNKTWRLWNDPSLAKKMGQNADKYVHKEFDSEKHYNKLIKIYKKLIVSNA